MESNKRILNISLVLIVISAIVTLIGINIMKIDKPVFLKNYREFGVYENEGMYAINEGFLELKYISNIDDERVVTGITFEKLPNAQFYASEYSPYSNRIIRSGYDANISKYGRYAVHTESLSCYSLIEDKDWKDIMLTKATVQFDDGLKIDIDLGKIIFYKDKETPIALEYGASSGSSDGTASMSFRLKEDAIIEKIESPLFDDALGLFKVNIDSLGYTDVMETRYKKGSSVIITSAFNEPKDIMKKYTLYDIRPVVHFINSYKDKYTVRFYNMTYDRPNFSCYGIYKYLKIREAI